MKNLKKVLSLVLALAMALSLMTVAFAADASDYADSDKITNTEAVSVLSALNVINGKDGNKFDPTGTVTRAEMAKMITVIALGDVDVSAFKGTTTDLKDATGWAEAYIKYCYSQGVISGRGNGIFDPNANVTSAEAAKMLLTAIGYNAKVQGYEGGNWKINTIRDAQLSGFFKNLSVTADKALTRDEAAQMIYNAVDATLIEKTSSVNRVDGTITDSYAPYFDGRDLLSETFGVYTAEVQLTNTVYQTAGANKGTYTVNGTYTKVAGDYSALLGQTVKVMFYDKDGDHTFDASDDSVYGIYAKYSNAATDVYALSAVEKTADKKIKVDGNTYTLADAVTSWVVGVDGTINTAGGYTSAANLEVNNSTNLFRLIDTNNDGKYDLSVVYTVNNAKVSYVDSVKVIAGATTYKFDSNVIADSFAKDDYAALSWNFTKGMTELTEIEKLTGKVTATKTNYVKVDNGEWVYNTTGMNVDSTYDYYVLNGVVVDKSNTTAVDISNLVYVSGYDTATVNQTARVYHVDGTSEVLTVDQTSSGAAAVAAVGLYTIKSTDYGYKFTKLGAGDEAADAVLTNYTYDDASAVKDSSNTNDGTKVVDKINNKDIADDAVIFVQSGSATTAKVITGKQLKTLYVQATTNNKIDTTGIGSFSKTVNGLDKVAIAAVKWQSATANTWTGWSLVGSADNYAVVTSNPITVSGGIQYTIWTGSENATVTDKTTAASAITKFSVIGYSSITSDNEIKDVAANKFDNTAYSAGANEIASAALVGYEAITGGYKLYLNSTGTYVTTDKDTLFLTINSAAENADEIGLSNTADIVLADKVYEQYCQNVIVYTATSGAADVVIFDTTNRLATAAATQVSVTALAGLTVTDANGNAVVAGTTKLKAGDLLTVKNASGAGITLATAAGVTTLANAAATGTYANGSTTILVVTGAANVNLATA